MSQYETLGQVYEATQQIERGLQRSRSAPATSSDRLLGLWVDKTIMSALDNVTELNCDDAQALHQISLRYGSSVVGEK